MDPNYRTRNSNNSHPALHQEKLRVPPYNADAFEFYMARSRRSPQMRDQWRAEDHRSNKDRSRRRSPDREPRHRRRDRSEDRGDARSYRPRQRSRDSRANRDSRRDSRDRHSRDDRRRSRDPDKSTRDSSARHVKDRSKRRRSREDRDIDSHRPKRRRSRSPSRTRDRRRSPPREVDSYVPRRSRKASPRKDSCSPSRKRSRQSPEMSHKIQSIMDDPSRPPSPRRSRGQDRGYHMSRPPRPPPVDTRQSFTPGFVTPNSSYHSSPQSGSPFGRWNQPQMTAPSPQFRQNSYNFPNQQNQFPQHQPRGGFRGHHSHTPDRRFSAGFSPPARGRGHFSNLQWTAPKRGSQQASPASRRPSQEDDNPFRPSKALQVEDENEKEKPERISFSFKSKSKTSNARPAKAKTPEVPLCPTVLPEMAHSDSIYFRRPGNESVVGAGTYGKVFKAIHIYTREEVALKKIRMEGERDGFPITAVREIKLLQHLRHEHVVALLEVMVEKNECFMVFEYLSHDMTGLINHPSFTLTSAHKKHLAQQMFSGLEYLHARGVLHRDIKAANILISNTGVLKFADFGLARFYSKSHQNDYTNRVITIWYRPPELLLGETQYGPAVDMWSAACVMVEMFTKKPIFPGEGTELSQLDKLYAVLGTPTRMEWPGIVDLPWFELMQPVERKKRTFDRHYHDTFSPAALDLITQIFRYDPAKRPTAVEALNHPYFIEEEPEPCQATELEAIKGDWHEYESKQMRREERRRKEEKRKRDTDDPPEKRLKMSTPSKSESRPGSRDGGSGGAKPMDLDGGS